MADIDKALNEVRTSVEIPGPEEQVEVAEEIQESIPDEGDTEITLQKMVVSKLILNLEPITKHRVKTTLTT
jgi:hypothetical protein